MNNTRFEIEKDRFSRFEKYWVMEWRGDAIGYVEQYADGQWEGAAWREFSEMFPDRNSAVEAVIRYNESRNILWDGPFIPQAEYPVVDRW